MPQSSGLQEHSYFLPARDSDAVEVSSHCPFFEALLAEWLLSLACYNFIQIYLGTIYLSFKFYFGSFELFESIMWKFLCIILNFDSISQPLLFKSIE